MQWLPAGFPNIQKLLLLATPRDKTTEALAKMGERIALQALESSRGGQLHQEELNNRGLTYDTSAFYNDMCYRKNIVEVLYASRDSAANKGKQNKASSAGSSEDLSEVEAEDIFSKSEKKPSPKIVLMGLFEIVEIPLDPEQDVEEQKARSLRVAKEKAKTAIEPRLLERGLISGVDVTIEVGCATETLKIQLTLHRHRNLL